MNEMVKMVVVLTVLSSVAGGVLAAVNKGTASQIEAQQLTFVKGPAIEAILAGSSINPIQNRVKISDGDVERSFFVGKFDGKTNTIAFEEFGKGFGGDIGVMIGVNLDSDQLVGAAVTVHTETPGLGAKAKDDPSLVSQFKGLSVKEPAKVTKDGGKITSISGATITSRAVCDAVAKAMASYQKMKPQLQQEIQKVGK
ncbi:MAG: RnfABCDGE type electron transport complex subunit G [Desulfobacteraceae bacterium]|nr:MAG: RnfABCDGE type electron transport complex subunit G [Desulfobacteraceae bacterium]